MALRGGLGGFRILDLGVRRLFYNPSDFSPAWLGKVMV